MGLSPCSEHREFWRLRPYIKAQLARPIRPSPPPGHQARPLTGLQRSQGTSITAAQHSFVWDFFTEPSFPTELNHGRPVNTTHSHLRSLWAQWPRGDFRYKVNGPHHRIMATVGGGERGRSQPLGVICLLEVMRRREMSLEKRPGMKS